ncbi:hypothetical protein [Synechocystis salina]|uniref:Uncharacterized protein n=1 Tax=Synechocystis salina LEGE 00031 TaxID=1828736 RepID=A0ABR9VMJ2_9SYNC|nr:hypothetical protein [Synechocystis salina]MBE9240020.1 hypothetical protein [Synechocystis salina LEGE 00041]MBE9252560.1 hypothetical protein [Synechocystis salina LEGE 00031]
MPADIYLGIETQRQWSESAILPNTPALLALFSIVTAFAHQSQSEFLLVCHKTAFYFKIQLTFVDALALVSQQLWQFQIFPTFVVKTHTPYDKNYYLVLP